MSGATTARAERVPALRFPEFAGEWERKRLGDIATFQRGFDLPSQDRKAGTIPIVSSGGITGYHNEPKVDGAGIVTGRYGSIGELFYMKEPHWPLNTALWVKDFHGNSMDFAFYHLSRVDFSKLSDKTGVPGINRNDLHRLWASTTSLPEQKKIAAFLGVVDAKIAALRDRRARLERYKRGLMQALFSQTHRFTKHDGSAFPNWEEMQADELFKSVSNKKHSGELPILAITQEGGAVLRDEIDIDIKATAASVLSYKIVEPGDFIISLRSFQGGIEYSKVMGICSPAYTILKPQHPVSDGFFQNFFKNADFISRLSATVVGIRDGKQISYSAFSTLVLPYPNPDEQAKIAEALSAMDTKIAAVGDQVSKMEAFKKGLLQQMFV